MPRDNREEPHVVAVTVATYDHVQWESLNVQFFVIGIGSIRHSNPR